MSEQTEAAEKLADAIDRLRATIVEILTLLRERL